ncbi:MAG: DUF1343 domain-containing protein [Rhodothermales bacterium]
MTERQVSGESVRRKANRFAFFVLGMAILAGCAGSTAGPEASHTPPRVRIGAEALADDDYALLAGKRVGLIANHTSMIDSVHLADRLHEAPGVTLAALFGPEHGLRGDAAAGEHVESGRDERTGVPIYSLYGSRRKPSPEEMASIDVLVFDIQDVGARFYTYISTMGLAMQAAAEAGVPFVVLDRPNPLGGEHVEGFVLDMAHTSFVGAYPIPVTHGLTVGELARMIQGEGWVEGLESLVLHVVPMAGWTRGMLWSETGLSWRPTSPNIPDLETALVYPGTCFFEAVEASEGRGTREPFKMVGATWANGRRLADTLNALAIPGLHFDPAEFIPQPIAGMATSPRFEGEAVRGVRLTVTDAHALRPVAAGMHLVEAFYRMAPTAERASFLNANWLSRLAGTTRLEAQLRAGETADQIVASWKEDVAAFKVLRTPYLLYP